MAETFDVVTPIDGSVWRRYETTPRETVERILDGAVAAQRSWAQVPLDERLVMLGRFVDHVVARSDELATELTWQMGRPLRDAPGEIRGFEERARHMLAIAAEALAPIDLAPKPGFVRAIAKRPLGVVFTIAAWNYPYLIAVNSIVPALAAGNAVVLKHAAQTPQCAVALVEAARAAGIPRELFAFVHTDHATVAEIVADPRIAFVCFTGSVAGGRAVHGAAAGTFKAVGLELGGKDPAYVRADAHFDHAVANLVEGAFYNAGQSCCGIERIYVHADLFERFVEAYAAEAGQLRLGNPLSDDTTLGPLVRASAAAAVKAQVDAAIAAGARPLLDPSAFAAAREGSAYLAPQVLTGVDHAMDFMREETFGPAVGIMPVRDDDEALALMNDSPYGLTASVWTASEAAAARLAPRIETGTVFMNRCDYLDPALAWTGVKDTGRGVTLSALGYDALTRPQSLHFRVTVG